MLVATFEPSSGCEGRTITFENEQFVHEILGLISAADVMEYDRKGWLRWPMDGMRAWVGEGRFQLQASVNTASSLLPRNWRTPREVALWR